MQPNKTFLSFFGVSLALGLGVPVSADILECKFTDMKQSGGYIPPAITLKYDEATNEVEFLSPTDLTDRYGGGVTPTLSSASKGRITFTTTVKSLSSTNQKSNMKYRLTWIKKNNRATVQALPLGYSNQFRAGGKCIHSPG